MTHSIKKHLFIVTYGRTGSTLLQGILNAHPKIHISGENSGLFLSLYRVLGSLESYESHLITPDKDTPSIPFFGVSAFPFAKVRTEITHLFQNFFPVDEAAVTRGFKEVRYDMPDLDNYLDFLRKFHPDSCFIFLTREHDAVLKSGFYQKSAPMVLRRHLAILDNRFHGYASKNPECSFEITYQDLLEFGPIQKMFSFIGHEVSEASWKDVIGQSHSYDVQSVLNLGQKSRLVVFDAAKVFFEKCVFELTSHEVTHALKMPLTGVIVPLAATGKLESLYFQSATTRHQAKIGIPSPGIGKKFPDNALATNARFSFAVDPPTVAHGIGDYELIGNFAHIGPQAIARLFVAPPPETAT